MSNTVIGATVEIEYQSIGNVRKALKEANAELIAMQDQFGATSQQAIKAAKKVAELKDRIEDARETADLFDPGKKFQAFVTLGSQIAAGFGAVQGAMALIGTESEAVEKSLLKVQSAMALAQGLSQLKDFGKSWQQLNVFIQSSSVFIKANAAANSLAAGAMRMFGVAVNTTSTSFKVLKGAIVSTGIGALLVVVGLVIEKLMAWANQSSRTEKSIEAMNAATKKLNSSLDNQISILEAIGGKEEEIYRLRQQQANNELATLRKTYAERTKEGKKFTDEELERFNQLKTQITVNDINEKKRLQKIEEDKKKDRDKSHASQLKDNAKHNKDIDKQNNDAEQKRLEAESILYDARKSLMSQREAELLDLEKKRIEEEKKLIAAGVKDRAAFDEFYQKQKKAIEDKYNAESKKREEDFLKQINKLNTDIRIAGITDVREKEREQLAITHQQELDDLRNNLNLTFNERLALTISLKKRQKQQEDALQEKFDQEDLKKEEAKLMKLAADTKLSFQQRNEALKLQLALANQIVFDSEDARLQYIKNIEAQITGLKKEEEDERLKDFNEIIKNTLQSLSVIKQANDADLNAKKQQYDQDLANLQQMLNNKQISEEQFAQRKKELDDEQNKQIIAAFKRNQVISIAEAIINTAAGITNALATLPPPFSFITAAATGVLGALQVKTIAKQKPGLISSSTPTAASVSAMGQSAAPIAPALSTAVQGQALNAEAINNLGNNAMRAYVLNSDIQNNDQRNAYLQRNARIG
jgi:hypothetical protein